MEKKEKNMIGEKIIGYICTEKEEQINGKNGLYVYIDPISSIALPEAKARKKAPIIYEIEGISTIKKVASTESDYYGRLYYICDNIQIIKEITPQQLIEKCTMMYNPDSVYRLIAFYPLNEVQALKLAKAYGSDYLVIKQLSELFPDNIEIAQLLKICIQNRKEKALKK